MYNKELIIQSMENRIHLLTMRSAETNGNIIRKLKRKLRNLESESK